MPPMLKPTQSLYLATLLSYIGQLYGQACQDQESLPEDLSKAAEEGPGSLAYGKAWALHLIEQKSLSSISSQGNLPVKKLLGEKADEGALSQAQEIMRQAHALARGKKESRRQQLEKQPLYSVFESAFAEENRPEEPYRWAHQAIPVDLSAAQVPLPQVQIDHKLSSCWNYFEKRLNHIRDQEPQAFLSSLSQLWEVSSSNLPAGDTGLPDVPLYEESSHAAGLAATLWEHEQEGRSEEHFALLVGADLSGIQDFIYQIVSKNASKNLKGRSYYLQLLLDGLQDSLKKDLDLLPGQEIYNSGGGFYLYCAHTAANIRKLEALQKEVNEAVYRKFKTRLYVAMDWTPLAAHHLFNLQGEEGLVDRWKVLSEKINARKRRRFDQLLLEEYEAIFDPGENRSKDYRDSIDGEAIEGKPIPKDDLLLSEHSLRQIKLGKAINQAHWRYRTFGQGPKESLQPLMETPDSLDYSLLSKPILRDEETYAGKQLQAINAPDFLEQLPQTPAATALGYHLMGGNWIPKDESGENKSFDKLPRGEQQGLQRLGVLRMDVDNLGTLFIKGLREEKRTLARLSALSRKLDWFFKGYINILLEELREIYGDALYVIYSGGDDLFVVGDWQASLAFAQRLREEFKRYTCENPQLSLSGGVVLVPPNYPIMRSAALAEEAEKRAKKHRCPHPEKGTELEKNAFTLFGYPLNWQYEFPIVKNLKDTIVDLIQTHGVSRSLLGRLQSFKRLYEESQKAQKQERRPDLRYRYVIPYNLSQFRNGKNEDAQKALGQLETDLFTNHSWQGQRLQSNYTSIELAALAARWAELQIRQDQDTDF